MADGDSTLAGYASITPRPTPDGFLAFARSVAPPHVYAAIAAASPLDDIRAHRFPAKPVCRALRQLVAVDNRHPLVGIRQHPGRQQPAHAGPEDHSVITDLPHPGPTPSDQAGAEWRRRSASPAR